MRHKNPPPENQPFQAQFKPDKFDSRLLISQNQLESTTLMDSTSAKLLTFTEDGLVSVPEKTMCSPQSNQMRATGRNQKRQPKSTTHFDRHGFLKRVKLSPLKRPTTTEQPHGLIWTKAGPHPLYRQIPKSGRLHDVNDFVEKSRRANISRTKLMNNGRKNPLTPFEKKQSWKRRNAPEASQIDAKRKAQEEKRRLADKMRKRKKRMEISKNGEEEKPMESNHLN